MYRVISSLVCCSIAVFFTNLAVAQDGSLNEILQCTLKPGFTAEEVITVGRNIPRDQDGPNLVFYREPVIAAPSRVGSINVVRYWDNFEHMIRGLEAATPSGPSRHFFAMVDCAGTRSVGRSISIVQAGAASPYEGGDLNESYVAIRQCNLNPGSTIQDVKRQLEEFDESNRLDDDKTGYGILHMLASGQPGDMNSTFAIRSIGENALGLAKRLDALPWNAPAADSPASCGNLSLWKSHVIHWGI